MFNPLADGIKQKLSGVRIHQTWSPVIETRTGVSGSEKIGLIQTYILRTSVNVDQVSQTGSQKSQDEE